MSANTASAPNVDPKLAAEGSSVPVAEEVNQSAMPTHNPEALEDAPRPAPGAPAAETRFQNVDLEAGHVDTTAQVPASSKPESPLEKSALTEMAQNMDWGVLNLLLAAASIVVMIASATICGGTASAGVVGVNLPGNGQCTGIQGYQVAVSTISAAIALVSAFLHHSGKLTDAKVMEIISVFQFLWWVAGMIVLTFFGDYQSVAYGNGYFGTWLAFFFAAAALVNVSQLFQQTVNRAVTSVRSPLLFLIIASAVAMGASIAPCSNTACRNYEAFAVALSVISLFISIVLMLLADRVPHGALKGIAIFLVLWWGVGFCVVTFGSPWIAPGNGYFASLGAVLASIAFLRVVLANA